MRFLLSLTLLGGACATNSAPHSVGARPANRTEGHRTAAEKVIAVSNLEGRVEDAARRSLFLLLRGRPSLESLKPKLERFREHNLSWESMRGDFVQLYVEIFTEDELNDLLAFYSTRTGQRWIGSQGELFDRIAAVPEARMQQHLPELQEILTVRVE